MAFLAKYVLGGDVSKWQGVMNWEQFVAAGAKFVFIRVGSINSVTGAVYMDDQFPRNREEAIKHLDYVGAYFYGRPNFDPILQANFFGDLYNSGEFTLPPVLDVEVDGDRTPEQVAQWVEAFTIRLYEKTGVFPEIIYTRAEFWNSSVADRAIWESKVLWIARYKSGIEYPWGNPTDQSWLTPRDWPDKETDWYFWQFSADNNGLGKTFGAESESIDLNYFNGDMQKLKQFSEAYFPPVDPPIDPPPTTPVVTAIVTKFFEVRSPAEGQSIDLVATVPNDEIWHVQQFTLFPAGGREIDFGYKATADNSGKRRWINLYKRDSAHHGYIRYRYSLTFQPGVEIEFHVFDVSEGQKVFMAMQVEIMKI